jgi:hypothetical protein
MTFFGRLSSLFRNSGSRGGSECNVMPTYSESVASIACARFTGPCSLPKDLRSRCEVDSNQPFALTWRGCPHCNAPAANHSLGTSVNTTFGRSLIRAMFHSLAEKWRPGSYCSSSPDMANSGFISYRKQTFSFLRKVYVI